MKVYKFTRRKDEYNSVLAFLRYKGVYIVLGKVNKERNSFIENNSTVCRDIVVDTYRQDRLISYLEQRRNFAISRKDSDVSVGVLNKNRTAFAIFSVPTRQKSLDAKLNRLLPLLNKFEKDRKWRRTKYYTLKVTEDVSNRNGRKLIIGSKCWSDNPFFLYIYTAAFKLFTFYNDSTTNVRFCTALDRAKTLQEVFEAAETHLAKLYKQYNNASKWLQVIKDRKKIFEGFTTDNLSFTEECQEGQESTLYGMGIYILTLEQPPDHWVLHLKRVKSSKGVTLWDRMETWRKENTNVRKK